MVRDHNKMVDRWNELTTHQMKEADPTARAVFGSNEGCLIWSWIMKNTGLTDFVEDGSVNMTNLAEHTIINCPDIDADDDEVWVTESGGVWDVVFVFDLWYEKAFGGAE